MTQGPRVEGMDLKLQDGGQTLVILFTTDKGEFKLLFKMKQARQLMRAIFLQIGVDPRVGKKE